eukprot:CFRG1386T1
MGVFPLDWPKVVYAIQVSVAVEIALLMVTVSTIEERFKTPGWVVMTVCVVVSPSVGDGLKKCVNRVLGTVFGGILGLITMSFLYLLGGEDCLQCGWKPILLHLLVLPPVFCAAYARKLFPSFDYAWLLTVLTFCISVSFQHKSDSIRPWDIIERVVLISVGVIIGYLVMVMVYPIKAHRQMQETVSMSLREMADASSDLVELYQMGRNASFLERSEVIVKRDSLLVRLAATQTSVNKIQGLLGSASIEYNWSGGKSLRALKLAGLFEEILVYVNRIFFTTATLYFVSAIEATGEVDEHSASFSKAHALANDRQRNRSASKLLRRSSTMVKPLNMEHEMKSDLVTVMKSLKTAFICSAGIIQGIHGDKITTGIAMKTLTTSVCSVETEYLVLYKHYQKFLTDNASNPQLNLEERESLAALISLVRLIIMHMTHLSALLTDWAMIVSREEPKMPGDLDSTPRRVRNAEIAGPSYVQSRARIEEERGETAPLLQYSVREIPSKCTEDTTPNL